jgi:hypothetical protein
MRDTTGVLFKEGLQQAHKEALQPSNFYLSGVAGAFLEIEFVMHSSRRNQMLGMSLVVKWLTNFQAGFSHATCDR